MAGYLAWMAALIVIYYTLPGIRSASWGLLGLSGVAATVAGVVINQPARKAPWLLLAGANLSFVAGQMGFLISAQLGTPLPFPSFADFLYLMTYPLYAAALLMFISWRGAYRDRRSLIDALILTCGLALLSWLYIVLPSARNSDQTWLQKSVATAYPLGDVLTLAMLARLLAPGTKQSRSVVLLAAGSIGMMVSDVAYTLIQLHGTFHNGTIVDLGWALFYTAWGAAALDPSMTGLTHQGSRARTEVSPLRLTVLLAASLIAPVVLFIRSVTGTERDAAVIAVFSAILYLLVLSRLGVVAASHQRALDRERAVRVTGAALTSAVTVEQVATSVTSAVGTLSGPHAEHEAVLWIKEGNGLLRPAGTSYDDPARARRQGELIEQRFSRLASVGPRLFSGGELSQYAGELAPGCDTVALVPLTLSDRPSGDPFIGVLVVHGQHRNLSRLMPAFDILARQATLAVERVMLSQEVTRQRSEAYFRTLVQDASDVILIVADNGEIRYATPSALSIVGTGDAEGRYLWDLVQPGERDEIRQAFARMRADPVHGPYRDWILTRADNTTIQLQVRYSDLRGDSTVGGFVLTLRDVTEQRELEDELKYRAFHDALTGMPNRLLFQDRVAQELARARRDGTTAGVLFLDLDDFKVVNDTMGHAVGDELLVAAADRINGLLRASDTAARFGGDEFALLAEHLADPSDADKLAERVVAAFGEPFMLGSGALIATASVGVATTRDSADVDELLKHADLALYAAKGAGKRQWRRYQPVLSAGAIRRRELQSALEEAVTNRDFTIVYQPIVTLTTGELSGFESLVRWPHAQWGMMQPDSFIALAEETGSIVPLGSWMLERAVTDLADWRRPGIYVSVNVSARQFRDPRFVGSVRRVLRTSGLPPSALMLELTESVLLLRDERVQSDLKEINAMGVRLAIDDFGTGYSSLSYLRELPIDVVKIDKSFIDGIEASPQRLALVEAIVRIAETLHLAVIAEGIETDAQRQLLISLDCHYGQGFLLAMPMSADKAETLARSRDRLMPGFPRQRRLWRPQWCRFQQPGGVGVGDGVGLWVGAAVDGEGLGDAAVELATAVAFGAGALVLGTADAAAAVGIADCDGDRSGLDVVAAGTADLRALALAAATAV
jgi:diguanylate cyclase (GGDEF)-like protein/PAS domain S-box-containing protein